MRPFHFYLATDGVGPGTTHYTFAVFGRRVNVSVTPLPPTPIDTGGGPGWSTDIDGLKYSVTVQVKFKGREYKQTRIVTETGLGTIEKVIASFTRVNKIVENIEIFVLSLSAKILKTVGINIKHKARKKQ